METQTLISVVVSVISVLSIIGGMGWKLNGELSSIKTMLQVFIAKSEGHFAEILKLEKRIEKLEERMTECYKEKN